MFHVNDPKVKSLLLKGNFGLEKESLRITRDGYLAHTPHPWPGHPNITRDFSENQSEINTGVNQSPEAVVAELDQHNTTIQRTLREMDEYLWPFSNPPYIRNEHDIPIAQFDGDLASKTEYRNYLSDRYGRYKMTFSGIHFNFSFADELLQADFELSDYDNFSDYKNDVYVALAERAVAYGWIMTAITAASPLLDKSYVEKIGIGQDLYLGLATPRMSELGYWNVFAPVFDYSSKNAYVDSMQQYVDNGFIKFASELYYPIRLKPKGENTLDALRAGDVNHIELRMFDLNPLRKEGIEVKDVFFGQLFLVWLASTPRQPFSSVDQVMAIQNFKNAAHFDLKTVKIVTPGGEVFTVDNAALKVLGFMEEFYADFDDPKIHECLEFQKAKFIDPNNRYAWQVRKEYGHGFVQRGLQLCKAQQDQY